MSGYNAKLGVFSLTATKAASWFRRRDVPVSVVDGKFGMDFYAAVISWQGLEIVRHGGSFVDVKATPEQLWQALSGLPSNPARASYYYR